MEQRKPEILLEVKNDKTEIVIVQALHEKAGFFEKTVMLGKKESYRKHQTQDGLTPSKKPSA